jgi:hypothetical protein
MVKNKCATPGAVIKRGILLLNNDLPPESSSYWLIAKDLWKRLHHVGVRKSLTLEIVHDALWRYNNNQEHLKVWEYIGIRFFQLATVNCDDSNVLPLGQRLNDKTGRWHCVNYSPVENYFVGSGNKNLFAVNNALKQLEDAEVKKTDVCSPLLLPLLLNVTVETAEG